ncbi:hypothetical protein BGZ72_005913 [Mortierella alpina]|nr:hypothetical protein BGZ72_005913 [Mortierella alpina]
MLSGSSGNSSMARCCRSKLSWLSIAIVAMSWASIASANIVFASFPTNTTVKPGDNIEVNWRRQNVTIGTAENLEPFNLVLRALTGQGYAIQNDVPQDALKQTVRIPIEATGGKHSFYAFYRGGAVKSVASNQFNITGTEVYVTTAPAATATNTDPSATHPAGKPAEDTGLSGGALAGIIGGAVVLLLGVALIFFFRNRRRVAEAKANNGSSTDDHKERGFTSGPDAYSSKNQDKESLTRSAGSGGGPHFDDGMVAVPLNGGPRGDDPRAQHQHQHQHQHQQHQQQEQMHQLQHPRSPTKNPFDAAPPGTSPRLQQYQPPQPPPHGGMPNPLMAPPVHAHQQQQLQRGPSPYHQSSRDSFESEIESAYDPAHTRMMNNNGNSGLPMHGSPSLSHSPSGRSTSSSRYPQNMSPQPHSQQQNPFANQHDREIMAAAAAVAAAASPVQGHRQLQQQPSQPALGQQQGLQHPQNKSPMARSASPRMKEIEMQPLDIQQHHFEQQQKMLQRQKLQQQQQQQQMEMQQQQQRSAQSTPVPLPAAQKSINPTQFDDKAEVEENDEENVPVYNGYRDTIFGAYAQNQDDDEEDEDEPPKAPVPALPASILVQNSSPSNASQEPSSAMNTGVVQIQRKKSVKFTGVPSTGPIVLPNQEAAKEHQQQRQQKKKQELEDQRPVSEAYTEDYGEDYEDEDDIRNRLMEIEAEAVSPIPSHASSRPQINTSAGPAGQGANVLSPVRSPDQGSPSYQTQGYVAPPLPPSTSQEQQQQRPFKPPTAAESSPSLNAVSAFGNGFYEDVLAAVEKKHVPSSPTSSSGYAASPTSPRSQQQEFKKPVMPPVPRSESPPPPQQYVQQQHIPAAQPQHMGPVAQEVFGAPSPRIAPAIAKTSNSINNNNNNGSYTSPLASATLTSPSTSRPELSPRSNARPAVGAGPTAPVQQQQQQQQQQSNDEFYENSLL